MLSGRAIKFVEQFRHGHGYECHSPSSLISIYIYIYIYISLSLSTLYIYIYIHIDIFIYIYIYTALGAGGSQRRRGADHRSQEHHVAQSRLLQRRPPGYPLYRRLRPKNTPPEKKATGKISSQKTKSGSGEQILLQDCRAKTGIN